MDQAPDIFYKSGRKYDLAKILLLKMALNFGHFMSRSFLLSLNFMDYVWILNHKFIENGTHKEPLKSILQNYFREKIGAFRKSMHLDNGLVGKNDAHMNILLTNLFNSTFFGIPIYFYKFESLHLGDEIIIKLWDLQLRTDHIITLASCTYNFSSFSAGIEKVVEGLKRLYDALAKFGLVLLPFEEFYVAKMKKRILRIGKLWHSGELARVKLTNLVGSTKESELLFDSLAEWLAWVKSCLASDTTLHGEIMLKGFKEGF